MARTVIRFDEAELDLGRYELRVAGRVVPLERIPMELLILLVEKRGALATRQEIVDRLWGPRVFVDTEQGVNTAVRKIRQALHDDPEAPHFVQTVVGRGYRLVPELIAPADTAAAASGTVAGRKRLAALAAASLLAAAVGGAYLVRGRAGDGAAPESRVMLAVLPFENLDGSPEEDYFSDGMTEELITRLGRLQPAGIGVIARTSSMRYKGARRGLDEVARELGVGYVIEGSARRQAGRVRITAQLIRVSDQTHLWAQSYDRDLRDVLALQAEVARAIVSAVRGTLARGQEDHAATRPVVPAAYEEYLRGRQLWNKRSGESISRAIGLYRSAIGRDPAEALAWAGLADAYMVRGYLSFDHPREAFPRARDAALEALRLDAELGEAHASLAYARLYYDWDFAGADVEFQRALELNPSYATGHDWYSVYLAAMGRLEEGRAQAEQARALDPLSLVIGTDVGWHWYLAREYDRAARQLESVLEVDPDFALSHFWLARVLLQQKRHPEAVSHYQQAVRLLPGSPIPLAALGHAYAVAGDVAAARRVLADLEALSRQRYVPAYAVAVIHAGVGDRDQAFRWMDVAFEERSHWLVWLGLDPRLDPLRADPRFADLIRRVGLPSS